jgi:CheY-like chemotaxis protein
MARVVVVDDERDLREMIAEELTFLGHVVQTAANGEEGLALIRRLRPDVVCCDVNMPRMSGFEVKAHVDAEGLLDPGAVFVFISAYSTRGDMDAGLAAGATHYLTKPIDFDLLGQIVGAWRPAEA